MKSVLSMILGVVLSGCYAAEPSQVSYTFLRQDSALLEEFRYSIELSSCSSQGVELVVRGHLVREQKRGHWNIYKRTAVYPATLVVPALQSAKAETRATEIADPPREGWAHDASIPADDRKIPTPPDWIETPYGRSARQEMLWRLARPTANDAGTAATVTTAAGVDVGQGRVMTTEAGHFRIVIGRAVVKLLAALPDPQVSLTIRLSNPDNTSVSLPIPRSLFLESAARHMADDQDT